MNFNVRIMLARSSVVILFTLSVQAQGPQTLHGTVRDPLGALVAGAVVELVDVHHLETKAALAQSVSNAEGGYTLRLPSNTHCPCHLRIVAPGFPTSMILIVQTAQPTAVILQTPTHSDQITVTATGTGTPLAQSGAPITLLERDADYRHALEIQQPLRLVPGIQMTASGQTGGVSSLYVRGGDSIYTKLLLDGVPANDIGGTLNFANLATAGIAQIEVLRQPNSVLYGSDALSGVVSLTTARGTTPLPLLTYAIDGGNLGQISHEVTLSGTRSRLDYLAGFSRMQTSNNEPDDEFHNATTFGNFGFAPDRKTDLRFTFRHLHTNGGQPNALDLYGIPDFSNQFEQDDFLSGVAQQQTTDRWHNLVRFGHEALNSEFTQYAPDGVLYTPAGSTFGPNGYLGDLVTIRGANGYSVTGTAILDFVETYPSTSPTDARRNFVYAQTDYKVTNHLNTLGAFKYESEHGDSSGFTASRGNYSYTLQAAGDVKNRLFYVLGSGIEDNSVYDKALTPRASAAFWALRPDSSRFLSGTKLHASFGKGVKESSVYQQTNSLFGVLSALPNGPALIAQYGTKPLGAEYSRTYDAGVEQQFGNARARVNLSYFHNEFTNGIQFVPQGALVALGVSAANDPNFAYGSYVNSQALRSEGVELESEFRLNSSFFVRAGYTFLDALVQHSFSSDAFYGGNINPSFPNIAIGAYAPLDGARPFRRAPHSGYVSLAYSRQKVNAQLTSTMVGRRDDSTFLSDQDFGNTLLLPNRNLDGAYQRVDFAADYRINAHLSTYASLQNLLNERYYEVFGYPALPFNLRGGVRLSFGGESFRLR